MADRSQTQRSQQWDRLYAMECHEKKFLHFTKRGFGLLRVPPFAYFAAAVNVLTGPGNLAFTPAELKRLHCAESVCLILECHVWCDHPRRADQGQPDPRGISHMRGITAIFGCGEIINSLRFVDGNYCTGCHSTRSPGRGSSDAWCAAISSKTSRQQTLLPAKNSGMHQCHASITVLQEKQR